VYRKISEIISAVFQPLLMPSLIVGFLLFVLPESEIAGGPNKPLIFFVVVANTFVIPLAILLVMRYNKVIPSMKMEDRKDRVFPFSMISLLYMVTAYAFYVKDWMDYKLIFILFIITICLILLTSISFFWKISAHMLGVGGLLGIILAYSLILSGFNLLYPVLGAIILTGAVGTARLYLNAHTPAQVWAGFLLGFLVCFGSFYMVWA
jgi:membrane-associated phospholipid phosphatase